MSTAAIRLAEKRDARAIADIYRPSVESSATSFELAPPGEQEMERRLAATLVDSPWLVCERGGEVLGFAYGGKHRDRAAYRWSVDVSVYILDGHHRRGVGRSLYVSLLALLRLQGFYAAHAGITLPNAGSVGLHESLGFCPVGVYRAVGYKFGAWRDVGWWQLPLREREGSPAPPLSVAEAQATPGWAAALAAGSSLARVCQGGRSPLGSLRAFLLPRSQHPTRSRYFRRRLRVRRDVGRTRTPAAEGRLVALHNATVAPKRRPTCSPSVPDS
jgi:L-amino acid N-acyltransferase YncA